MGDELKQDQFQFFYECTKILFDSALQKNLYDMKNDKTKVIEETVIPEMIAYKSIMRIRNIQLRKAAEAKKAKEKAERNGEPIVDDKKCDHPLHMTEEEIIAKKLENEDGQLSLSEMQKIHEAERKEREIYGRFWIWEGYFNEKLKEKWLETAEQLKHINPHILQDIEDYILLKGFGRGLKPEKIKEKIEADHRQRIEYKKKFIQDQEEKEKFDNKAKDHIRKRKFMDIYRPHAGFWNLFEDGPEDEKVEHVLRYNADPTTAYKDGRVQKILDNITEIAVNLRSYEKEKWDQLLEHTH